MLSLIELAEIIHCGVYAAFFMELEMVSAAFPTILRMSSDQWAAGLPTDQ